MSGKDTNQYSRLVDFLRYIILTSDEHIGTKYSVGVVPSFEPEESDLYLVTRIDEEEGRKIVVPVYCDDDIEEAIDVFIRLEGESVSIRREVEGSNTEDELELSSIEEED